MANRVGLFVVVNPFCVGWTTGARPGRAENCSSARRSGGGLSMSSRLLSGRRQGCWGAWQAWRALRRQNTFEQAFFLRPPGPVRGWCGHPSGSLAVGRNLGTLRLLLGAAYLCSGAVVIGCLGPMVGTVVVAVNPPGPSAQMAIAEAAGPCPEDTAFYAVLLVTEGWGGTG